MKDTDGDGIPDDQDPQPYTPNTTPDNPLVTGGYNSPSGAAATTGTTAYVPGRTYAAPESGTVSPMASGGKQKPVYQESVYGWVPGGSYAPVPVGDDGAAAKYYANTTSNDANREKDVLTYEAVKSYLYTLPAKKLEQVQKDLHQLFPSYVMVRGQMDPNTVTAVSNFLDYASELNANGDKRTWGNILSNTAAKIRKSGQKGLIGADGQQQAFSGTRTTTSTNVKYLSQSAAKHMAEQAYTTAIGRTPSGAELQLFRASMDSAAQADPVTTTTDSTFKKGILTDRSSETRGGVDYTQAAIDDARSQPGYGEFQAASTYFNALMSAIGSPGGV